MNDLSKEVIELIQDKAVSECETGEAYHEYILGAKEALTNPEIYEAAGLTKSYGWININDKLPEVGVPVTAWDNIENVIIMNVIRYERGVWFDDEYSYSDHSSITFWMPKINPPKKINNE